MQAVYDSIMLPQRATAGSAGYDFYVPAAVTFPKDASVLVPTGIRARMAEGWVLSIFPRSGLGFKHRIGLDNTVGIIDADYYGSSNEGHIMIKMSCTAHDAGHSATVAAGDGFAQGIFLPFGITEDDAAALNKENTALYDAVNTARQERLDDGTIQSIIDKYITAD